ncbi:hypothetical protein D3C74_375360 [compost metagenome]
MSYSLYSESVGFVFENPYALIKLINSLALGMSLNMNDVSCKSITISNDLQYVRLEISPSIDSKSVVPISLEINLFSYL